MGKRFGLSGIRLHNCDDPRDLGFDFDLPPLPTGLSNNIQVENGSSLKE